MKPFIATIVVAIAILLGVCDGKLDKKGANSCADIKAKADLSIEQYAGLWFQYGGNIPCPGCCVWYFLGKEKDGFSVSVTSSINRGKPNTTEFKATQDGTNKGSFTAPPDAIYKILWTNYETAAVAYTEVGAPSLCLFTRYRPTKEDLKVFEKYANDCNVEINLYNPCESCTGIKPKETAKNKKRGGV